MDNNMKYLAIGVVAVIVIAAAAFVFIGDNGDGDENSITFLIQDNQGVYFWADGNGDTAIEAFEDAVDDFDMPFVASTDGNTGEPNGISSLFGLETVQVDGTWYWWSQFSWNGEAWESNEVMMDQITAADCNGYMAIVYADWSLDTKTLPTPGDAKVWNGSEKGTVFTIESSSGMSFKVNGQGDKVIDAFVDATNDYKIPFVSTDKDGKPYGIDSLYGLNMYQDAEGNWHWWGQYVKDNGVWTTSSIMMDGLSVSENPEFKIVYN